MISDLRNRYSASYPKDSWTGQKPSSEAQLQVYQWLTLHQTWWLSPLLLVLALFCWEGLVRWQELPSFILPSPAEVGRKFIIVFQDGTLMRHLSATVIEIGLGLLFGLSVALLLGYWLGKSRTVERLVAPYIVASQSVPIIAIAPLLVIWLGSGLSSKVLVCALIVFFPTLISTMIGIRSIEADQRSLMLSYGATPWQLFRYLEVPSILPVLFGGLKLSAILSVVGAVVGEFVGADVGLGFLINLARGILDTPLMFVAVISLVIVAQALYLIVALIERKTLAWQRQKEI